MALSVSTYLLIHILLLIYLGAGPSGLVAAKTLTHDHKGSFHVTVFEQSHRIGGLWPISNVDDGMVHPEMCTNQSRHTVSFSDLAWPETSPSFPKAWQVGQYLERYIKTYPGYKIRLNTRVSKTELLGGKWRVNVQETLHNPETLEFDHLIVASGFFGKPKVPQHFERKLHRSLYVRSTAKFASRFKCASTTQLQSPRRQRSPDR